MWPFLEKPVAHVGDVCFRGPVASDPTGREHLWFEVHGVEGDRVT